MRSYEHVLLGGVAEAIADADLGSWDYFGESGTPYTGETYFPIYVGPEMPTDPDRAIILTPGISTLVRLTTVQTMQVRVRGGAYPAGPDSTPDAVMFHAGRIRDLFLPNGFPLVHVNLGTVRVGMVQPLDILPLAPDANRRSGALFNLRIRARRSTNPPSGTGYGAGGYGD